MHILECMTKIRPFCALAEEARVAGDMKAAERHRHHALLFERYLLDMHKPILGA